MGVALLGIVSIAVQAGREAAVEAPSPDDVRRIVAAVVEAAEQNAAAGEGSRREGDRLTEFYVRRAAAVADREHVPPRAMLLALGVALDDTELLRNHPVARFYLAQLESDEERQRRLRVLGRPTLYGRRDWLQHFAVSAALAALAGEETSELIGIRKEIDDARGGSGFSFADLQADYAGIALATAVLGDEAGEDRQDARLALGDLAEGFRVENFVPPLDGLEEGVSWRRFVEEYGGAEGERFQDVCEELRARARGVPGLSPIKFCRRFKGIAGCSFSTARRARGPRLHGFTGGACVVTRDSTVQDAQRVAGAKRSVPRPGCRPAWGVAQCRSRARRAGRCKAKRLIAPRWPIRRGTASLCPGHPGRRRPRGPFCTRPLQAVLRSRSCAATRYGDTESRVDNRLAGTFHGRRSSVLLHNKETTMGAEQRLRELKLELPPTPKPVATYVTAVRTGNLLFVSGHGPLRPDGSMITGKVGDELSMEQAIEAARAVGLAILATVRHHLGSLDAVGRLVKVLGMVNAPADFAEHPRVINGFSDLMVEVFGDAGRGARSAVGMGSLPGNIAVEIEAIFEVK